MGKAGVELALKGHNAIMPTIVRASNAPYRWEVGEAPLSKVANVEKFMPRDFISQDGLGITAACKEYLIPLIQGEDYPPFEKGLPKYVTLKNAPVAKKLAAFEL
jgi:6-phosphofructokinase 1